MDTRDYFRIEATELIAHLTAGLRELPSAAAERAETLWRELRRAAHTLKGACHVVRETQMAQTAHTLEDALAERRLENSDKLVDELAALVDGRVTETPAAAASSSPHPHQHEEDHASSPETLRIHVRTTDELLSAIAECSVLLTEMRGAVDAIGRQRDTLGDIVRQVRAGALSLAEETLMRASMDSRRMQAETGDTWTRLRRELMEAERIAHSLRLAPAQEMLLRVERAARRAAEEAGITVQWILRGGEERIDLHLLAAAEEALGHMVRNAVVHGLAGRTSGGRVEMGVQREGSQLRFYCADNGAGIDLEHLRRQAVERGWMTAENAAKATRADLMDMLARPGFTTRATAEVLSGRGIGLDVVRTRARQLGGDIVLDSEPGRGSTVALRVPESLLALPCVVLELAGQEFAVPFSAVEQTKQLSGHRTEMPVERFPTSDASLLDCGPLLGLPYSGEGEVALEVKTPAGKVRLGVDRIVRVEDLVIEPVQERWQSAEWIMGTYMDAAGRARLVMDPMRLRREIISANVLVAHEEKPQPPVLVIDDSLTSRTLLASIFFSAGYEVDTAVSAEDGLEKAAARNYGIFFVDVEMPGMDGFEFVRITRADPRFQDVPVVMITSRNQSGDRDRGITLGASEYIVKGNFDQNKLLATASRLLDGKQRAGLQE